MVHQDRVTVESDSCSKCVAGFFTDQAGRVQSLWLTITNENPMFNEILPSVARVGTDASAVHFVLKQLRRGDQPTLRVFDIELRSWPLSSCEALGVSNLWIEKVKSADPSNCQLLMVQKLNAPQLVQRNGKPAFQAGDVILTVDDEMVTRYADLSRLYDRETVMVRVVRNGEEKDISVRTVATNDIETIQAIMFGGAVLQQPHQAVRQRVSKLPSNVYISCCSAGSAAAASGMNPTNFITHVDDVETTSLETFMSTVSIIPDNTYVKIHMQNIDNRISVVTYRKNEHYFPVVEYKRNPDGSIESVLLSNSTGCIGLPMAAIDMYIE